MSSGFDWTSIVWGQSDSGDESPVEAMLPKTDLEKLNSPVTAETPEERDRLWALVRQYASG